jgi:hypothetical protein
LIEDGSPIRPTFRKGGAVTIAESTRIVVAAWTAGRSGASANVEEPSDDSLANGGFRLSISNLPNLSFASFGTGIPAEVDPVDAPITALLKSSSSLPRNPSGLRARSQALLIISSYFSMFLTKWLKCVHNGSIFWWGVFQ